MPSLLASVLCVFTQILQLFSIETSRAIRSLVEKGSSVLEIKKFMTILFVAKNISSRRERSLVVSSRVPFLSSLLDMQGEPQQMSKRAERFARQLEGRFGIPTSMTDERLTTREAWLVAIESGEHRSKPQIDSLAAALITESWLRALADK